MLLKMVLYLLVDAAFLFSLIYSNPSLSKPYCLKGESCIKVKQIALLYHLHFVKQRSPPFL